MKKVKDGWHIIAGKKVYTEDGFIVRGITGVGLQVKTVYPYRAGKNGGWDLWEYMTPDAFRRKLKAGTAKML